MNSFKSAVGQSAAIRSAVPASKERRMPCLDPHGSLLELDASTNAFSPSVLTKYHCHFRVILQCPCFRSWRNGTHGKRHCTDKLDTSLFAAMSPDLRAVYLPELSAAQCPSSFLFCTCSLLSETVQSFTTTNSSRHNTPWREYRLSQLPCSGKATDWCRLLFASPA